MFLSYMIMSSIFVPLFKLLSNVPVSSFLLKKKSVRRCHKRRSARKQVCAFIKFLQIRSQFIRLYLSKKKLFEKKKSQSRGKVLSDEKRRAVKKCREYYVPDQVFV
uniref:Uncharacterized protein n=1 Tax=Cacopsylla melanoneura TaxID=428564 RepID=A0A8D8VNJ7_9HEMI